MTTELYIAISGIVGLIVGLAIDRSARHERDKRICELEKELTTMRNVADSQNERINKQLRIINKSKKNGRTDVQGDTGAPATWG